MNNAVVLYARNAPCIYIYLMWTGRKTKVCESSRFPRNPPFAARPVFFELDIDRVVEEVVAVVFWGQEVGA